MRATGHLFILICLGLSGQAIAQDETDALRYSLLDMTGSARLAGLGGAFGALGGDVSALSQNPGGIGVFNKSTFAITPSLAFINTDTDLRGSEATDSRTNFNVGNIGFVFNINRKKATERPWSLKSFQFGIGYNRMGTFQRQVAVRAASTNTSYIDHLVNDANGKPYTDLDQFGAAQGWETYLFDQTDSTTNTYARNLMPHYGQQQQVSEYARGSLGEVAISMGGNVGNKLYLGLTFGIPRLDYQVQRDLTESDPTDTIANFTSFTRTEFINTKATGFNVKFGVIYKPIKWFRVGAAIHSPTYFGVDEQYSSSIVANVYDTSYSYSSPEGVFSYSLSTPFKVLGSVAFVIKDIGLITADYEYVNYSLARLSSSQYGFNMENEAVKTRLHWAGNIRIGTEWRIKKLSLRGGFAVLPNPYTGSYDFSNSRYSLGAGYGLKHFFFDFTYLLQRQSGSYLLYGAESAGLVSVAHNILFTVGVRF